MALRDGWQLQKELLPSLFSLTVTMLPTMIPVRHYLKKLKKKSSSLMEMMILCPDLLVEAIIRMPPPPPALCVFFFHCLEAALICLRQFYNKLRDAFFKSF